MALGLLGTAGTVSLSLVSGNQSSAQVRATGQALMQSQRMAKSVSAALVGNPAAFAELRESVSALSDVVNNLRTGKGALTVAPASVQPDLEKVMPLVQRAEKNGRLVQSQEKVLTQVGQALHAINKQSSDLAGERRGRGGAVAATGRRARRDLGRGPTGDADAAHRQEREMNS